MTLLYHMAKETHSIARSDVRKAVKRYNERGDLSDPPRRGGPRSLRFKQMIKYIREKIRRNPRSSTLCSPSADCEFGQMRRFSQLKCLKIG